MTVEWTELADYLAGDLDTEREAELERALFEDFASSAIVERFLELTTGIAVMRRHHGSLSGCLTAAELDELRDYAALLEVEVTANQTIAGHIPESVDICVAHLLFDPSAVTRADVELHNEAGQVYAIIRDVPIDRENHRIAVACERHMALEEDLTVFRVVAVDNGTRRSLGDFGLRNLPPPA